MQRARNLGAHRKQRPGGLAAWRESTPEATQAAILACFWGEGTDAQKEILDYWVWRCWTGAPLDASREDGRPPK